MHSLRLQMIVCDTKILRREACDTDGTDRGGAYLIALCIQGGGVLDDDCLGALLGRATWTPRLVLGP